MPLEKYQQICEMQKQMTIKMSFVFTCGFEWDKLTEYRYPFPDIMTFKSITIQH